MSTALCQAQETRTASRSRAAQAVPWIVFALGAGLYLLPISRLTFVGSDQGSLVDGAARVAHGQVFARDFFEVMGPGTFYWLAMFFKFFGVNCMAARVCMFVTYFSTALSLYYLSRQVCARYAVLPCLLGMGLACGAAGPGISHHTLSNAFALLCVVCAVLWWKHRRPFLLASAGVLAALTASVHLPKGALLFMALLLWIASTGGDWKTRFSAMSAAACGFCVSIAAILAFFWSRGGLWDLVYANFVWPSKHYAAVNHVSYAQGLVSEYWHKWAASGGVLHWSNGVAAVLIVPYAVAALLPVALAIAAVAQKWKTASPAIVLFWLCGWALWLSEIHRMDIDHLTIGAPLLIVVGAHLLAGRREKMAEMALQLLAISATCLCGFAWLQVMLGSHSMETRAGSVAMYRPDRAIAFLDEHTLRGEEIFAYPYSPIYYFLSDTTNPTRYSFLVYNYNTPSQFRELVQTLEQHRTKYVVWNKNFNTDIAPAVFPASLQVKPADLIVEPYLESHYRLVENDSGVWIMERKPDSESKQSGDAGVATGAAPSR